jgi:Bifunctional DNA primase/polymerase, N-terminal
VSALLDAAYRYVHCGLAVLPVHTVVDGRCSCGRGHCDHPAKHPRTDHGLYDATTDVATVEAWWHEWPTANVGIRTGLAHDVLDVDPDGLDELSGLVGGDDVTVACGPCVRTPRAGAHLWYEPTGIGPKVGFRRGLDWRGVNGYAIAPPSVGVNGVPYEWHQENGERFDLDRPLVPAPGWLRALLETRPAPNVGNGDRPGRRVRRSGERAPSWWDQFRGSRPEFLTAALEAEARAVAGAPVGTRNDQLNRSTHTLARPELDDLEPSAIVDVMRAAAVSAGLSEREALRTIHSALEARGVA